MFWAALAFPPWLRSTPHPGDPEGDGPGKFIGFHCVLGPPRGAQVDIPLYLAIFGGAFGATWIAVRSLGGRTSR